MKVLAIETSCDETAASVVEQKKLNGKISVLSNVISSSLELHIKTGGIVPEVAAREQLLSIIEVVDKAIKQAGLKKSDVDAIGVTYGPGLIGSLLIGVETAKVLSLLWKKPLIKVNHLLGHLLVVGVEKNTIIQYPAIGMVISGGHTDMILMESAEKYQWIGGTRDDAVGECFDKCARILLDVPYPGGPAISQAAKDIKKESIEKKILPRPMIYDKSLEMSFSGLKTAVLNKTREKNLSDEEKSYLATDLEKSIVEVLISKLSRAISLYSPKNIILGGGVLANELLRLNLDLLSSKHGIGVYYPKLSHCSDNAVMIGAAALIKMDEVSPLKLFADPGLSL